MPCKALGIHITDFDYTCNGPVIPKLQYSQMESRHSSLFF